MLLEQLCIPGCATPALRCVFCCAAISAAPHWCRAVGSDGCRAAQTQCPIAGAKPGQDKVPGVPWDGGAEALGRSLSLSELRADGGAQGGALPIFLLSMM